VRDGAMTRAQRSDGERLIRRHYVKKQMVAALSVVALMAGVSATSFAQYDKPKLQERLESSTEVLNEIMSTPDKGIPEGILASAKCLVVVPHFKKGAWLVGAQYGQGVATCRTPQGWSAPVFVKLEGGSFGFQIGGQSTDLILVAMNEDGLQHMLHNKFKLGADAAASAGPVGRNAQAGTDWKLNAEFLTYSRSKGLFAGLDLDGTVLSQNDDATRAEYGANVPFNAVLSGSVPTPPDARQFEHTVAKYFIVSRDAH
jgi:lipid-binding SYLF domain-containing protein